jgi:glycosyltransferase involved in cell wall biosynthesis
MCGLEALASGRAVVTTDAVGCRETVREGENGFLVPVGAVEPLAKAMERFVQEPSWAARMGAAGRRLAETRFASEHVNEILFRQMKTSPQNTQNTQKDV